MLLFKEASRYCTSVEVERWLLFAGIPNTLLVLSTVALEQTKQQSRTCIRGMTTALGTKLHYRMYGQYSDQSTTECMDHPGVVYGCRSCSWSAEQGRNVFFLYPCSRLRIWSREKGSAVSSRVSLLILYIQAESGAYSLDSSCFPAR